MQTQVWHAVGRWPGEFSRPPFFGGFWRILNMGSEKSKQFFWKFLNDFSTGKSWFLSDFGPGVEKSKQFFWRFFDDFLSDLSRFLSVFYWFLSDFGPGVEKFKQFFWRFVDDLLSDFAWLLSDLHDFWVIVDRGSRSLNIFFEDFLMIFCMIFYDFWVISWVFFMIFERFLMI